MYIREWGERGGLGDTGREIKDEENQAEKRDGEERR